MGGLPGCFGKFRKIKEILEKRESDMAGKKEKPVDLKNLEPEDKLKYEIAEELGLLDRVLADEIGRASCRERV